jgi:hypothetical protein
MGGLRRGALALAGLGVVLAAAGTSLLEKIDTRRSIEAAWRWIESPPGGTGTGSCARCSLSPSASRAFGGPGRS